MKKLLKEALSDTLILSVLVIVPIAFLGPGWQTSSTYDRNGRFSKQHQSVPGEAGEDGEAVEEQQSRRDRDIPLLRAFEVEREAERTRR